MIDCPFIFLKMTFFECVCSQKKVSQTDFELFILRYLKSFNFPKSSLIFFLSFFV